MHEWIWRVRARLRRDRMAAEKPEELELIRVGLAENLLIGVAGAVGGLLLAKAGIPLLRQLGVGAVLVAAGDACSAIPHLQKAAAGPDSATGEQAAETRRQLAKNDHFGWRCNPCAGRRTIRSERDCMMRWIWSLGHIDWATSCSNGEDSNTTSFRRNAASIRGAVIISHPGRQEAH